MPPLRVERRGAGRIVAGEERRAGKAEASPGIGSGFWWDLGISLGVRDLGRSQASQLTNDRPELPEHHPARAALLAVSSTSEPSSCPLVKTAALPARTSFEISPSLRPIRADI